MESNKKHIVITGASSGIGLALAKQCKKEGHSVSALSRWTNGNQSQLTDLGIGAYKCNVRSKKSISSVLEQLQTKVDILVLNAGVLYLSPTIDQIEEMMSVNHTGAMRVAEMFSGHMTEDSVICGIGSYATEIDVPEPFKAYKESKKLFKDALLDSVSKFAQQKIRVKLISASFVTGTNIYRHEEETKRQDMVGFQNSNAAMTADQFAHEIYIRLTAPEFANSRLITIADPNQPL